jgi:fatty-acyl-CoA synthase
MTSEEPNVWVDGLTFGEVLSQTAKHHGERDAVVFPQMGLKWSYTAFEEKVRKTARALMSLGVGQGDHVGIWSTNQPEWVLAQFGAALMGAVLVNVNPAYRSHELAHILKQADIKVLLLTDSFKTSDYEALVSEVVPEVDRDLQGTPLESDVFPKLRHVVSIKDQPSKPGIWAWSRFLQESGNVSEEELAASSQRIGFSDPVNIQFTSGTTGTPKGAMLSHRNLLLNTYYLGERLGVTEMDRVCIPVPLYHSFGCVMGTIMCVVYGAAMVIPAESFNADATLEAIDRERCTVLYGVPTMFNAEVHSPRFSDYDYSSLRKGIMAGASCPIELMRKVTEDMHVKQLTITYGQTETSPVVTQSRPDDPLEVRVATVGSPLPGLEVRLVDPETGQDVAVGEQGEFCSRGHCVMLGYYKNPEATAATIDEDGWLHSGDLATQTPEGNYRITGRIKDMVIRGGENIYPREIEEFLMTHPGIRDAQVVGVPDEHYGEQISAWIIPKEPGTLDAEAVRAFCKGKIAHYKVPHYVECVGEYPLTVSGKVQKFKLREEGIKRFGLEKAASIETA